MRFWRAHDRPEVLTSVLFICLERRLVTKAIPFPGARVPARVIGITEPERRCQGEEFMSGSVIKVRSADEIQAVCDLVWEFFDFLRLRYPEMHDSIDAYIQEQNVVGELENFGDFFLPPRGESFLALNDGEPVGIVMLKPHGENDGEMNRMFIRDTGRGLGLGRKLGEALVAEARALGYGNVWLDAIYRHVEALPLYESLGFERYTDANAFHGDDERFIHMKLKL